MKNILVTGGLGFIGSVTCSLLLKKGFNIIIIDNNHVRNRDNLDNLLLISSNIKRKLFLYDYDLKNLRETNSVFSDHNIDGVIHFAALKSVPDSMKDPFEYYSNNILGSLNLQECNW
jgi:UDP-glucose 4-epimerase